MLRSHRLHSRSFFPTFLALILVMPLWLAAFAACSAGQAGENQGGSTSNATPTEPPASDPAEPATTEPTPTPPPLAQAPLMDPGEDGELGLRILGPSDGAGVEVRAARILGSARADAIIAVDGTPVSPAADGSFHHDVALESGINYIEVVAADIAGTMQSESIVLFAVSPSAALPLSLFYPADGLEVQWGRISVIGATRQDAVVGVNGEAVEINAKGIFSATVGLEAGANLIEVVAADANDNVNFQTVTVFYTP